MSFKAHYKKKHQSSWELKEFICLINSYTYTVYPVRITVIFTGSDLLMLAQIYTSQSNLPVRPTHKSPIRIRPGLNLLSLPVGLKSGHEPGLHQSVEALKELTSQICLCVSPGLHQSIKLTCRTYSYVSSRDKGLAYTSRSRH